MKTHRFTNGRRRVTLPDATLTPCRCDAFRADLEAGAYRVSVWQFEDRGRPPVRARVYSEALLGRGELDSPLAPTCPHCGGELGETERLMRALYPAGWEGLRPTARASLA
ncbi:hypothetical protein [Deinococcus soli (ex Cha et al. 2016)]|uniref:Uncharacterized protein n=2 Tax=Deinococcus soli (ex Cha et al. 2016) TaxID=1309411 RepID=A0AAE3XDY1_9DEIO|nr:hypothetical protein [Deinococcus soli (ex Cha et al. 2016)]MDR6218859.1 hypothetical protein [Deinococcus soli (ex Cha et al. 2016)]MDR6328656.1 hypothetical protein [Deinococcus soli (ex Cha et al. 2016)]MDR6751857.1 hypothetical protein [Deinococcus soli (ex Cha et al. 2016)]